jgi:hypothetical protein
VIAPDIETLTSIPHYSHKVTKRFEVQGDSDVKIKNGMLNPPVFYGGIDNLNVRIWIKSIRITHLFSNIRWVLKSVRLFLIIQQSPDDP